MKKRFLGAVLGLSLLCSCAAPAAESPIPDPAVPDPVPEETTVPAEPTASTADIIAQAILASQPDGEGYAARTGEDLDLYLTGLYGLEDVGIRDAAVYTASGVDAREVAVVRLASMTSEGTRAVSALEEYRRNRLGDFLGYAPDQAALVEGGEVVSGWYCVALLLCEDVPAARAAFETAAGRASVYTPPEEPTSGESAAPVGLTPEETRWLIPFDPPGKFDMTPYDTSAILTAWETGEERGLTETDSRILKAAKAALEACGICDAMSAFEKELALHDWLVENVSYDRTVHDPGTPMGRTDNLNPCGPLVNGYGICLGYATAFQLLMDMAGVECVTVVGASNESRQDHAWNMVKLEGEWYCVDVTWDDPTLTDPSACSRTEAARWNHNYFNVTSDDMRWTNHQWDYGNVPEATATRFRWDGVSEKPA